MRVFKMLRRSVLMLLTILRGLSSDADAALAVDPSEQQRLFELKRRAERSEAGFIEIGVYNELKWPFKLEEPRVSTPRLLVTKRGDGKAFFVVGPLLSVYVSDGSFEEVNSNSQIGHGVFWVFQGMSADRQHITFMVGAVHGGGSQPTVGFTLESEGGRKTTVYEVEFDNRLAWPNQSNGLAGAPGVVTTMLQVTEKLDSASTPPLTYEFEANGVRFVHTGNLPGDVFGPGIRWRVYSGTGLGGGKVGIDFNRDGSPMFFSPQR